MTAPESIKSIHEACNSAAHDCERLAARGNITLWEAAALRSKVQAALCAALELEQRARGVDEPKRGES